MGPWWMMMISTIVIAPNYYGTNNRRCLSVICNLDKCKSRKALLNPFAKTHRWHISFRQLRLDVINFTYLYRCFYFSGWHQHPETETETRGAAAYPGLAGQSQRTRLHQDHQSLRQGDRQVETAAEKHLARSWSRSKGPRQRWRLLIKLSAKAAAGYMQNFFA